MVRNADGHWVNSALFNEAARTFQKTGSYTSLPKGSPEWLEFWLQEWRRCREGYEVGGARITGHHYFYLNYCPIKRKDLSGKKAVNKRIDFPDFYDGDYDFFHSVEIARWGTTEEQLKSLHLSVTPKFLEGGRHLIVAKARRKGYSYKNAAIVANTYNTIKNSLSIIGAANESYLYPEGTFAMVERYLSHLNKHTAWEKKRIINRPAAMEFMSGYKVTENGIDTIGGYQSSIIGVSFNNNPDKARGKDGTLMLWEEAGAMTNLISSYNATLPAFTEGDQSSGIMILFGTGGESSDEFSQMFYEPEKYHLLPFVNQWDDGLESTNCGFFVPAYKNLMPFIDENGNSDEVAAKELEETMRRKIASQPNGMDALAARVVEFPFNPQEAFMQKNLNDFPIELLSRQLTRLRTDPKLTNIGQPVSIFKQEGAIKVVPDWDGHLKPLNTYPVQSDDIRGAIVVYEHPIPNAPKGLYKIGYDPYVQDTSQGPSLGAIFVYKGTLVNHGTRDMVVAEFVGRPSSPDDCHRIAELLAEYYNAQIMIENMVKDAISYFSRRMKTHLLCTQPDTVISGIVKNSKVQRGFGVHMNAQIKDAMTKYIKNWLLIEREDGTTNIDYIYSQGLIEELIKYNPKKGNFDRVFAFGMVLIQLQEESEGKIYGDVVERQTLKEFAELIQRKYAKN